MPWKIIFDETAKKEIDLFKKNFAVWNRIQSFLDMLEEKGPSAGKLLDSALHIYELKAHRPPLRMYYRWRLDNSVLVVACHMKTSSEVQRKLIQKLRTKFRYLS